jgi:hypothetical protein
MAHWATVSEVLVQASVANWTPDMLPTRKNTHPRRRNYQAHRSTSAHLLLITKLAMAPPKLLAVRVFSEH